MNAHSITMLGTGLIGAFYTSTLHGQRGRDLVRVVYSRSEARGEAFRDRWGIPESTTDMAAAVNHPDTDVVVVGLPNFLHEEAVALVAQAGKAVLCTKPLGRSAQEARLMLDTVETAGVFAGYLEDLCYTPKTLKAVRSVEAGAIGEVTWVRSREAHPGPHSAWFWDGRLTGRGHVPHGHARPPDRRRGQRRRAHPLRVGRPWAVRGQLDVPWGNGPPGRGRGYRRNDLAEPFPADRLRDVLGRDRRRVRRREGRDVRGLALPGRRRGDRARLCRHVQRHVPGTRRGHPAARDVLRWLRRQRDHGRLLPVGEEPSLGAGRARGLARSRDAADRVRAGDVRRPGRHQARGHAGRTDEADPERPRVGRLQRPAGGRELMETIRRAAIPERGMWS